ncbi:MAG: hypothetical protein HY700_00075 [Gemmatimonadetes bacterium]|nr:hypothetical protein [Gemmatimonadota bacterium]
MSPRAEPTILAGGTAAAVAVVAACAGAVAPSSGIDATVRRGPIAPVEQQGVDNTAPVAGAVVVVVAGDRAFGGATTDATGTVSIAVPPGDYQVRVTVCPGAMGLPPATDAHVDSGSTVPVRLECDTGIR